LPSVPKVQPRQLSSHVGVHVLEHAIDDFVAFSSPNWKIGLAILALDRIVGVDPLEGSYLLSSGQDGKHIIVLELVNTVAIAANE
jgi:uncharacterized membrane protein